MNLWRSRGHAVWGIEIKVSRSDWLRELKNPAKAEAVYRYCDHWVVLAPQGVVRDGELPADWGLLELRTNGMGQMVAPPRLSPEPLYREFFASMMRRGHEGITALAEAMQHQAISSVRAEVDQRVFDEVERSTRRHQELQARIAEFEATTGLTMRGFTGPSIRTVQLAQKLEKLNGWGSGETLGVLNQLADRLIDAADAVRKAVSEIGLTEIKT